MSVIGINAFSDHVRISTASDSAGDSAAYIDFTIKADGTPLTVTSLEDDDDSTIWLYVSETITTGQVITLTYVPNSERWITAPHLAPAYVLFAMTDAAVTNTT